MGNSVSEGRTSSPAVREDAAESRNDLVADVSHNSGSGDTSHQSFYSVSEGRTSSPAVREDAAESRNDLVADVSHNSGSGDTSHQSFYSSNTSFCKNQELNQGNFNIESSIFGQLEGPDDMNFESVHASFLSSILSFRNKASQIGDGSLYDVLDTQRFSLQCQEYVTVCASSILSTLKIYGQNVPKNKEVINAKSKVMFRVLRDLQKLLCEMDASVWPPNQKSNLDSCPDCDIKQVLLRHVRVRSTESCSSFCLICLSHVSEKEISGHVMTFDHMTIKEQIVAEVYPFVCRCHLRFCSEKDMQLHSEQHSLDSADFSVRAKFEPVCCYLCKIALANPAMLKKHMMTSIEHGVRKNIAIEYSVRREKAKKQVSSFDFCNTTEVNISREMEHEFDYFENEKTREHISVPNPPISIVVTPPNQDHCEIEIQQQRRQNYSDSSDSHLESCNMYRCGICRTPVPKTNVISHNEGQRHKSNLIKALNLIDCKKSAEGKWSEELKDSYLKELDLKVIQELLALDKPFSSSICLDGSGTFFQCKLCFSELKDDCYVECHRFVHHLLSEKHLIRWSTIQSPCQIKEKLIKLSGFQICQVYGNAILKATSRLELILASAHPKSMAEPSCTQSKDSNEETSTCNALGWKVSPSDSLKECEGSTTHNTRNIETCSSFDTPINSNVSTAKKKLCKDDEFKQNISSPIPIATDVDICKLNVIEIGQQSEINTSELEPPNGSCKIMIPGIQQNEVKHKNESDAEAIQVLLALQNKFLTTLIVDGAGERYHCKLCDAESKAACYVEDRMIAVHLMSAKHLILWSQTQSLYKVQENLLQLSRFQTSKSFGKIILKALSRIEKWIQQSRENTTGVESSSLETIKPIEVLSCSDHMPKNTYPSIQHALLPAAQTLPSNKSVAQNESLETTKKEVFEPFVSKCSESDEGSLSCEINALELEPFNGSSEIMIPGIQQNEVKHKNESDAEAIQVLLALQNKFLTTLIVDGAGERYRCKLCDADSKAARYVEDRMIAVHLMSAKHLILWSQTQSLYKVQEDLLQLSRFQTSKSFGKIILKALSRIEKWTQQSRENTTGVESSSLGTIKPIEVFGCSDHMHQNTSTSIQHALLPAVQTFPANKSVAQNESLETMEKEVFEPFVSKCSESDEGSSSLSSIEKLVPLNNARIVDRIVNMEEKFINIVEFHQATLYQCSLCSLTSSYSNMFYHALSEVHLNQKWADQQDCCIIEKKLEALRAFEKSRVFESLFKRAASRIEVLIHYKKKQAVMADLSLNEELIPSQDDSLVSDCKVTCHSSCIEMSSKIEDSSSADSKQETIENPNSLGKKTYPFRRCEVDRIEPVHDTIVASYLFGSSRVEGKSIFPLQDDYKRSIIQEILWFEKETVFHVGWDLEKYQCSQCLIECSEEQIVHHILGRKHFYESWTQKSISEIEEKLEILIHFQIFGIFQLLLNEAILRLENFIEDERSPIIFERMFGDSHIYANTESTDTYLVIADSMSDTSDSFEETSSFCGKSEDISHHIRRNIPLKNENLAKEHDNDLILSGTQDTLAISHPHESVWTLVKQDYYYIRIFTEIDVGFSYYCSLCSVKAEGRTLKSITHHILSTGHLLLWSLEQTLSAMEKKMETLLYFHQTTDSPEEYVTLALAVLQKLILMRRGKEMEDDCPMQGASPTEFVCETTNLCEENSSEHLRAQIENNVGIYDEADPGSLSVSVVDVQSRIRKWAVDQVLTMEKVFVSSPSPGSDIYKCALCSVKGNESTMVCHILGKKHLSLKWTKHHSSKMMKKKFKTFSYLMDFMMINENDKNKTLLLFKELIELRRGPEMKVTNSTEKHPVKQLGHSKQDMNNFSSNVLINDSLIESAKNDVPKSKAISSKSTSAPHLTPKAIVSEIFLSFFSNSSKEMASTSEPATLKKMQNISASNESNISVQPEDLISSTQKDLDEILSIEKTFVSLCSDSKYWCSLCSVRVSDSEIMVLHILGKKHLSHKWSREHTLEMMEDKLKAFTPLVKSQKVHHAHKVKGLSRIKTFIEQRRAWEEGSTLRPAEEESSFNGPFFTQQNHDIHSDVNVEDRHSQDVSSNAIVINDSTSSTLQEQYIQVCGNRNEDDFEIECGVCGVLFEIYNQDMAFSLDMHIQNDPRHSLAVATPLERDAQNISLLSTSKKTDTQTSQLNQSNVDIAKEIVVKEIFVLEKQFFTTKKSLYICFLCSIAVKNDAHFAHHLLSERHLSDKWAEKHTSRMLEAKLQKLQSLSDLPYFHKGLNNAVTRITYFLSKLFGQDDTSSNIIEHSQGIARDIKSKHQSGKSEALDPNPVGLGVGDNSSKYCSICHQYYCNMTKSARRRHTSVCLKIEDVYFCSPCGTVMPMHSKKEHLSGKAHRKNGHNSNQSISTPKSDILMKSLSSGVNGLKNGASSSQTIDSKKMVSPSGVTIAKNDVPKSEAISSKSTSAPHLTPKAIVSEKFLSLFFNSSKEMASISEPATLKKMQNISASNESVLKSGAYPSNYCQTCRKRCDRMNAQDLKKHQHLCKKDPAALFFCESCQILMQLQDKELHLKGSSHNPSNYCEKCSKHYANMTKEDKKRHCNLCRLDSSQLFYCEICQLLMMKDNRETHLKGKAHLNQQIFTKRKSEEKK